jgi:acetyl-CoA carboxylase alpha subunit
VPARGYPPVAGGGPEVREIALSGSMTASELQSAENSTVFSLSPARAASTLWRDSSKVARVSSGNRS